MNKFIITEPLVRKLLATVDAGLVAGAGIPEPGKMCVEAAISYALGEPHSDGPSCVDPAVRRAKIVLNDASWSSDMARASGMRRVAIAQLGSRGIINPRKFIILLTEYTIREIVPIALRAAASCNPRHAVSLEEAARRCKQDGTAAASSAAYATASAASSAASSASSAASSAAYAAAADAACAAAAAAADAASAAAYAAASAAYAADDAAAAYAVKDCILSLSASIMVRALQECGSPGCDWLWLVDATEREHP